MINTKAEHPQTGEAIKEKKALKAPLMRSNREIT